MQHWDICFFYLIFDEKLKFTGWPVISVKHLDLYNIQKKSVLILMYIRFIVKLQMAV